MEGGDGRAHSNRHCGYGTVTRTRGSTLCYTSRRIHGPHTLLGLEFVPTARRFVADHSDRYFRLIVVARLPQKRVCYMHGAVPQMSDKAMSSHGYVEKRLMHRSSPEGDREGVARSLTCGQWANEMHKKVVGGSACRERSDEPEK
jgi:hypothetical protein